MPRGKTIRDLTIGLGLTVVSVGAFALGNAVSDPFRPLPAVVTVMPDAVPMPAARPVVAKPAPAAVEAAKPVPAPIPNEPPASPPGLAPPAAAPRVFRVRDIGFLAELKDVPEAIAAVDAFRGDPNRGDVSAELDRLIAAVRENRDNPMAWSQLAAALDRAQQRQAAIAVANRGMNAAKRQQDGEAMTQLTQQLAQLELSAAQTIPAKPAQSPAQPQARAAVKAALAQAAEAPPEAAPDKLAAALDEALRNSAAADALRILQQMAEGSIGRGDFAAAQRAYNDAMQIAHAGDLKEARADQYANLGRLHWKKGDKTEAEAFWRAARDQYEQLDVTAKVAEMNTLLRQGSPGALASPSRPTQSGKRTTSVFTIR